MSWSEFKIFCKIGWSSREYDIDWYKEERQIDQGNRIHLKFQKRSQEHAYWYQSYGFWKIAET